jgi:hypothetical protein
MDNSGASLALVANLLAEVKRGNDLLAALLNRSRATADELRRPAPRRADVQPLRKVVSVLCDVFEDARFSVWEAYDIATTDAGIAGTNIKLGLGRSKREGMQPTVRRACGHDIKGLRVERDGIDSHGNVWKIMANAIP